MKQVADADDEAGTPPEDIDTGEPIELLGQFEEEAPSELARGIRGSIQRRMFASDLADLSWSGVTAMITEFIKMVFELLSRRTEEEQRDER